jgi:hypothetical protein
MKKIELPMIKFRFELEALEEIPFPVFRGSAFRGAFGRALMETVDHRVYQEIFESHSTFENSRNNDGRTIPNPYFFDAADYSGTVQSGGLFDIGLALFGTRMRYVEHAVNAVVYAAEHGFSVDRGRARVNRIFQVMSDGSEELLYDGRHVIVKSQLDKHFVVFYPEQINCVEIDFITPTRLLCSNELPDLQKFTPGLLFSHLIGRIRQLFNLYSHYRFPVDYSDDDYQEYIRNISVYDNRLRIFECARYSSRQDRIINLDGFSGRVVLTGRGLDYLAPYLAAGEYLRVGHAAVMGLGQYRLNYLF